MDVTLITTGDWSGWWKVIHPTAATVRYIKYSIPNVYRNFVDGVWYVHEKYVDSIKQVDVPTSKPSQPVDLYAVLHLRPTAPPAIIKAAWRELAKLLHPDHGGNPEEFLRAKEAYETLIAKR